MGPGPLETVSGLVGARATSLAGAPGLPASPGSYVLLIELGQGACVLRRGTALPFAPGWYAYVGSARGPGGLRARLSRHLRSDKKPHWHVDALTAIAVRLVGFAVEGAFECDLGARLVRSGHFSHVHPGFGSSDCHTCPSHLLEWRGEV